MWFEFFPNGYSYGVGMFRTDADYLECFRKVLAENQKEFKEAIRLAELTNAICNIDIYKKDKPGIEKIDAELKAFYNCRNFGYIYYNNDLSSLVDGSIKEELKYAIRAFAALYRFLLKVTERMYEKGDYIE